MRKFIEIFAFVFLSLLLGCQMMRGQSKRALLIGISDYGNAKEEPNKWANISGANDIALLAPLFKRQNFYVKTLVDKQATHSGIIKALGKLTKECKKGDIVYLHFSVHGQPFEDLNGDEPDGWDEALIPFDAQMTYKKGLYEGKSHLIDDDLEKYISTIRTKLGTAGTLFVVLDACHSGTSSRGDDEHIRGVRDGFTRSGKLYTPDRSKETNAYFRVSTSVGQAQVTFIEACRSYQVNKEIFNKENKTWYGSLSFYIAKVMSTHRIDKSGKWIDSLKVGMSGDRRLRKQNIVIESSK